MTGWRRSKADADFLSMIIHAQKIKYKCKSTKAKDAKKILNSESSTYAKALADKLNNRAGACPAPCLAIALSGRRLVTLVKVGTIEVNIEIKKDNIYFFMILTLISI